MRAAPEVHNGGREFTRAGGAFVSSGTTCKLSTSTSADEPIWKTQPQAQ